MFRATLLALGLIAGTAASAAPDSHAAAVLAQAKTAMGGEAWASVHFVRTKAHAATSGLSGTTEDFSDANTGYFVSTFDLGVARGASGFDGKTVWSQDDSGQVAVQGSDDAVQGAMNAAYQNAHGYWRTDKMPAEIAYSGAKTEAKRKFDVLRLTPQGGRPFDMWVDAETHTIDRVVEQSATQTVTTFMSDYRKVSGALVAYHIHQTTGEMKYDTDIKVDSVAFEDTAPPNAFAPPPPPVADFGFTGKVKTATVPFNLINNHMYVKVKLNGKGPYELLFDTGGRNVITPTLAKALGVKSQGALQGGGVGNQSQDFGIAKLDRMEIGGAFLDHPTFVVIALESFGAVEGKPISGIFGYEVFKRFIVTTDYERSQITFTDPAGFAYKGSGIRVPFEFDDSNPMVDGTIDGIAGRFTLDTGSRSSLDLASPFVAKHDLVKHYNAKMQGVAGWGVGGASHAWFVRARKLTLGDVTIDAPVMGLSQQTKGSFSNIYEAGNVGAGVLKKFNIVWDYGHRQIWFEKNKNYGAPDVFDRAGLWANEGDGFFDVVDVYENAPASEAGLKVGDKIVAVNGKHAVSGLSLPDFRAALRGAVGSKLKFDVMRGTEKLTITVTLRDLV